MVVECGKVGLDWLCLVVYSLIDYDGIIYIVIDVYWDVLIGDYDLELGLWCLDLLLLVIFVVDWEVLEVGLV